MMQSTWHLLFVLSHIALIAGLLCSERSWPTWGAVPATFGSAILFSIVAIYAESIQVTTDTGIETVSEPALGIYAFALAILAYTLAIVMALNWLPKPNIRGGSHGY